MALNPGTRLGPYEILAPLGAGGMGEVYRARDTRLGREVAVKVLPAHLSSSAEVRARFEREARVVSSLNHPHICTLHDVGHQDGVHYLVMEHLEGETVADRLARGPLPVDQLLRSAVEIADALDRAHKSGIIHRDLKPGNIMLTKSGTKLLDFGLARATGLQPAAADLSHSPTMSRHLTAEGTIVGTFQYMAPEQLEGKEADARTDIFAFGATLYEMATGKKAFTGTSQASLIAAILKEEPRPIGELQPLAPPALDRVVQRCLAKDPDDRWQSARDLMHELRWIAESRGQGEADPQAVSGSAASEIVGRARPAGGGLLAWIIAGGLAVLVLALAVGRLGRGAPGVGRVHAAILPPENAAFVSTGAAAGPVAVSPDGSRLAFVARQGEGSQVLWVRPLDASAARPLPGTEGATMPFWSPDGRSIGFFASRRLKTITAEGGPAFTLTPAPDGRGGTWNREGIILFAPSQRGPLYRIPAEGGEALAVTAVDNQRRENTHRYPQFLPDGRHFLYLARRSGAGAGESPGIFAGSLDGKESKRVVEVASNVAYAAGQILYVRQGTLVAQSFDLEALAARGEAVTIADDVRMDERFSRGVFSAADSGVLVYQTGKGQRRSQLRWLDRSGRTLQDVGGPTEFFNGASPAISPDGTRASVSVVNVESGLSDIWIIDLASGNRSRFTFGSEDKFVSIWSPDGKRIAFYSAGAGDNEELVAKSTNAAAAAEVLVRGSGFLFPGSWSPDGRFLMYMNSGGALAGDILLLPLTGDRKPVPFVATDALEQMPQFSPNGRYVAYVSDESGWDEVYATVFPGPGAKWQVSQGGGIEPRWRSDGRELFFFAPDNRLMAAQVKTDGAVFEATAIEPLFQARGMGTNYRYDVARDGQRFLLNVALPEESVAPITMVLDWTTASSKR